jgi:hypothetical protein
MPFLFKPYRSTQLTQEVLARLRLKLVLSESPLLFFGPGIGHLPRGLSHSSFCVLSVSLFFLCLVASLFVVFLGLVV